MAFAAAIAGFGQLLRGSDYIGDWSYGDAIALATEGRGCGYLRVSGRGDHDDAAGRKPEPLSQCCVPSTPKGTRRPYQTVRPN